MARILAGIAQHDRVAVRAGRKVSKTTSGATAALWWALRGGKVLVTAPSAATLADPFWLELTRLAQRLTPPLHVPLRSTTPVATSTGGRIIGRQAAKRENLQGPSGAHALYILEEASGVRRDIFEAIEGNVAGGGKILMIGNPTQLSGVFYDAFHADATAWHTIHLSSRDSPNVTGETHVPGLAIPEWIEDMEARHGEHSAFVAVHVNGDFPTTGANSVIPLALITAAEERHPNTIGDGPLVLGVDVARSGDDESVIIARRGKLAHDPIALRDQTGTTLGRHVITTAEEHRRPGETVTVNVDVIGVGASVLDWLTANAPPWITTHAVNVAENATSDGHHRLRDQLAFATRDWLLDGGALPRDDRLRTDLAALQYDFDPRGRYRVTPKDDLRETLGRSPDRGDALHLAQYAPPTAPAPRIRSLAT